MANLVTQNIEEVKQLLDQYIPFDTTVRTDNLVFGVEEKKPKLQYHAQGKEEMIFRLNDFTLGQFLQHLNKKFNVGHLKDVSDSTKENIVNDLLRNNKLARYNKKRQQLLIRSEDYTRNDMRTVGILTTDYTVVNHSWLFDYIKQAKELAHIHGNTEEQRFEVVADYDFCNVRFPLGKISDERLGVFGGVEFTNGQTGKVRLMIKNLLYELVCANGMTLSRGSDTFMDKKHLGRVFHILERLPEWLFNVNVRSNEVYRELKSTQVFDVENWLKKKMVKKYSMLTLELANQMLDYIKQNDSKMVRGQTDAWEVVRSITYLSQQWKQGYTRFEYDDFAFTFAQKEFLN